MQETDCLRLTSDIPDIVHLTPTLRPHNIFGVWRVVSDRNAPQWQNWQASGTSGTFRSLHRVRMAFAGARVVLMPFAWENSTNYTEAVSNSTGTLATCLYTASLECPAGSAAIPLTWNNGQTSLSVPPNTWAISDPLPDANALVGQDIAVRLYVDAGVGDQYVINDFFSTGGTDSFVLGSDQTQAVTWSGSQNGRGLIPALILGNTGAIWTAPVVGLACDSLYPAFRDGCVGTVVSVLCGQAGDRAMFYRTPAKRRLRTMGMEACSHVLCNLGHNDITNGRAATQWEADMVYVGIVYSRMGIAFCPTTISPRTNSTDSWTTVAGQSVYNTGYEAQRVLANNWLRDGAPLASASNLTPVPTGTAGALRIGGVGHPFANYLEIADVVETSRNSGFFKAPQLTSGTATGGTTTTLIDSSKSWTPNALAGGGWVKITGGTGAGQVKAIVSNTATTLTISGSFTTPPDTTSSYLVSTPYVSDGVHFTGAGVVAVAATVQSWAASLKLP